jgi:hypothetical protein
MNKEDMVCEKCRFIHKREYDICCCRYAPVGPFHVHTSIYYGVPVSRTFYCAEGEWLDNETWKKFTEIT